MKPIHTIRIILLTAVVLFSQRQLNAQTIPVGLPGVDESLRVLQLQGKLDSKYSLSSRPFFTDGILTVDSILRLIDPSDSRISASHSATKKGLYYASLPLTFQNQFNSHHPYGWNHAGMISAKGYQGLVSTGFFASYGPLSLQLKPEFVYAMNPGFEYSSQYGAPTRRNYHRVFAGQSSIRINAGPVSFGLSTENMWWGPGIQNALLMSNNAPGFAHLVLNSTRPIQTPIGNFEFQLVAGKLTEDTSVLLENSDLTTAYYAQGAYAGLTLNAALDKNSWRYLNGIYLSYNPKWVKGLFLGVSRVGYTYHDYIGEFDGFIHSYLPVFIGLFRTGTAGNPYFRGSKHLKQLLTVSGRYLLQKSNAEFYFEYGSDDNTANIRDFLMSPDHARAFTVGFKKILPLRNHAWVDLSSEITELAEPSPNSLIRSAGYWYVYNGGYTNQGRIVGAGFGMGSNMQTISGTLVNGFAKTGISFQRIVHDPNRSYYSTSVNGGSSKLSWKDIAIGFTYQRKIGNLQWYLQSQLVSSSNYAWIENSNPINLNLFAGINYFWGK